jgi:hypothetical protein
MTSKDLIYRQAAIDAIDNANDGLVKDDYTYGVQSGMEKAKYVIEELPSAQQERLTDDDFETIRIHLNACKEKLCNQRRWKEAEEYQRIIDRFMAFASAQPERKKGKWIYSEDEYGIDGYHCDKCGFFVPWDYAHKLINYIEDYHYCPNCGADMRG